MRIRCISGTDHVQKEHAEERPNSEDCHNALSLLCEHYWYPVYAYVCQRGYSQEAAQDLTQEFFVRILEGRYLNRAD